MKRIFVLLFLSSLWSGSVFGDVTATHWTSAELKRDISVSIYVPSDRRGAALIPFILYIINTAVPRVGTEPDVQIIADFEREGYGVIVFDYEHRSDATLVALTRDFVQLRRDIQKKVRFSDLPMDPARIYLVPSGFRLARDVVFYHDDANPTAPRTLAMDIIYPSQPRTPVGAVLEFSCDNTDRMGNFSLDFCTDVVVPAAAFLGHAAVMADHPVAAPYKGFDAMPDVAYKVKASVRTLRAESRKLGLNGRIVTLGFSRGSGMALLAATSAGHPEFSSHGENQNESDTVQGAVVMSGRFTYLDLLPDDKMIPRYVAAWGPRETNLSSWKEKGALDFLTEPLPYPVFLTINATESPDALHQMAVLRERLTTLGSAFIDRPETQPRGHKMPVDESLLTDLFSYLNRQLTVAGATPQRP